jgi:hypothetical protein
MIVQDGGVAKKGPMAGEKSLKVNFLIHILPFHYLHSFILLNC